MLWLKRIHCSLHLMDWHLLTIILAVREYLNNGMGRRNSRPFHRLR